MTKSFLMPRYYFDLVDEGELFPDEEGLELTDLRAVQAEAAKSLADMARDAVHTASADTGRRHMAVQVRDEFSQLMEVKFTFAIERRLS